MGVDPDPDQIPIDPTVDFDTLVQQAFFIYHVLTDKIDGMAGVWLGKDFSGLMDIMNIYQIENKKEVMDYLLYMIQIARESYSKERENRSKAGKK